MANSDGTSALGIKYGTHATQGKPLTIRGAQVPSNTKMSADTDMVDDSMENGKEQVEGADEIFVDPEDPLDDGYKHWQRIRVVRCSYNFVPHMKMSPEA